VRARRLACALAATAIGVALGGVAVASAQTISDLTSDLQNLQVRIAAGDKAAYASQAERISAVGAAIVAAKPEVWQSKHETDAAVIYLFSGGQPRDIVRLIESGAVPPSEIPLLRGALAYVLGNEAEAEKRLSGIDARRLPLRLAGPMAFAQSVIETSRDSAKAIELLDLARLLAPGTLVEEAALRREVMLEADQHEVERLARLARQYASRFGSSVYAEAFLQTLAGALAQSGAIDNPENFSKFRGFFAALAPDARRGFLLGLARAAILNGRFEVASMAATAALDGVPPDTVEEARGKLYEAMARILTPNYDAALAELQSVAQTRLDRHDQELLAAARGVAAFLREPPASSAEPPPAADVAAMASANPNDAVAQTIVLAEAALGRTAPLAAVTPKGNL
jgi:chemotaxis protein MotC